MKRLHFLKSNNLSLLHDELLAAVPALAPIRDAQGLGTAVMAVEGTETEVWLTVPDTADETTIAAVVTAHDPTKVQTDPTKLRLSRIQELVDIGRSNWTASQRNELIELLAKERI